MTQAPDTRRQPTRPGRRTPRAKAMTLAVLGIATAGAVLALHHASSEAFLVINESRSMPRGLYRMSDAPIIEGAIVTIIPPLTARAYLETLGAPADVRLLKRVAAIGGDKVCRHETGLEIAGITLDVARHDREGRSLPQWPECRTLGPEELMVLGDSPDSFDSRYFGPINRSEAIGPYVEAIHW